MKKLTLIVIFVALIVLLVPPVVGLQAQQQLEVSLARANVQGGGQFEMSLQDYSAGWFSSHGKIRLGFSRSYIDTLAAGAADGADASLFAAMAEGFTQDISVSHGPIIMGENTNLGLAEMISAIDGKSHPQLTQFLAQTGNPYLLRTTLRVGFSGLGDFVTHAPAFTYTFADANANAIADASSADAAGNKIVFAGADATGSLDLGNMHVIVQGQMNGVSFASEAGEAVLERTTLNANMAYPDSAPYGLGSGEIHIDRLVAFDGSSNALDLRQAKVHFSSTVNNSNKVGVAVTYSLDSLQLPDVKLDNLNLTLKVNDLDTATLSRLQNLNNNFTNNADDMSNMLATLREPAYDLMAAGVSLHLQPLRFTYNDKPFNANFSIASKPQSLPPKQAFTLDNPLLYVNLFSVQADLLIDQSLAQELAIPQIKQQLLAGAPADAKIDEYQLEQMARAQAPMMMGVLAGQGIIQSDGTNYLVKASYDAGALTVNGNPFPLGAFLSAE